MPDDALATATAIARQVEEDAVWDGNECNWLGADMEIVSPDAHDAVEIFRALDQSLYDGTAGVGLFLAELAAATGGERSRQTAFGALRHALAIAAGAAPTRGLYSGSLGVALAAARAGLVLDSSEQSDAARTLVGRIVAAGGDELDELDLMAGAAGTTVGLLILSDLLSEPELVDAAVACGDELIERAEGSPEGLSWPSPATPDQRNLTGLSHGAAGIGLALLELHAKTGAERFAAAARGAFAYERSVFDPEVANWPDFREAGADGGHTFAMFWCHGAPGIALSRLRAAELGARDGVPAELATALGTTRKGLERDLTHGRTNLSLCHGMCGNAEVMAEGGEQEVAGTVADRGRAAYADDGSWPCGGLGGQTPGLMLGLSGIGHFYLRRARPDVPSVLLMRPGDWARYTVAGRARRSSTVS